jgi:hypothetical protein
MRMPGFGAEASLGKTRQVYRRYRSEGQPATGVFPASWCLEKCQEANDFCRGICDVGDALGYLFGGGDDGGSGGPRCCPVGETCRCGGSCQTLDGVLQCVGGVCLRPNQECP